MTIKSVVIIDHHIYSLVSTLEYGSSLATVADLSGLPYK
jgi:hypothetical protein